jgi:hypothetical protein
MSAGAPSPAVAGHGRQPLRQTLTTPAVPFPLPRDWGPALGPAGIFGSIYLLAASSAPSKDVAAPAGSFMSAALVRQRFAGDTIHLSAHIVINRPANAPASAAPIEGTATFVIPALGIDISKDLKADEAAKICKQAPAGPAGALECNLMLEVRGAWGSLTCSGVAGGAVSAQSSCSRLSTPAGPAQRLTPKPRRLPLPLLPPDHHPQVQGGALVARRPRPPEAV